MGRLFRGLRAVSEVERPCDSQRYMMSACLSRFGNVVRCPPTVTVDVCGDRTVCTWQVWSSSSSPIRFIVPKPAAAIADSAAASTPAATFGSAATVDDQQYSALEQRQYSKKVFIRRWNKQSRPWKAMVDEYTVMTWTTFQR
jgi:hypothetical protein